MLPEFNNIKGLILKGNSPIKTSKGSSICTVLKVLENDGFYRNPLENEFPNNNSIFINGYDEVSKFYEGTEFPIFRLSNPNNNSSYQYADELELYKTDLLKSKFRAYSSRSNFFYLPQIIPILNFAPYPSYNWEAHYELFPNDNQAFFVESNSHKLYGPFVYNNVSKELFPVIGNSEYIEEKELLDIGLEVESHEFVEENEDFIFEFKMDSLPMKILEIDGKKYVQKLSKINDKFYFGDDEKLIQFIKNYFTDIKKADFDLLEKFLAYKDKYLRIESDDNKIKKIDAYFATIVKTSDYYKKELPELLFNFLKKPVGRSLLHNFLNDTEEGKSITYEFLQEEPKESEITKQKIAELNIQNEELREKIEDQFTIIQEKDNAISRLEKLSADPKLDLVFKNDEDRTYFLENKEKILKISIDDKSKLRLEIEIENLEEELKKLKTEQTNIVDSIAKHIENFTKPADIGAGLLAFQTMSDIISGQYITKQKNPKIQTLLNLPNAIKNEISFKEYQFEVTKNLKQLGRDFDEVLLSNYLVTLERNFLTVFLGYPGVGKTSLVERLAKAAGLYHKDEKNNRFKKIAVEKGWNSTRDLLGFYNSITKEWVNSKTGVMNVLEQVSYEKEQNVNTPPFWILLDEANLSPIENYWSNFNSISDNDYEKKIVIEDGRTFQWDKEKIRFIATVNFDHTTESLSPRLVSRASVIKLSPSKSFIPEDAFTLLNAPLANKIIFETLSDTPIRKRLNELKDVLNNNDKKFGTPIHLSPRKFEAILDHFKHLAPIIDDENKALDLAISQHLLPLIFAQGKSFEKRLEELMNKLTGLDYSKNEVESILAKGSDYQIYSFFNL